jgi:hypothetical protein
MDWLRRLSLAGATLALALGTVVPAAPALAQRRFERGRSEQDWRRGPDPVRREWAPPERGRPRCWAADSDLGGSLIGAIAGGLIGRPMGPRAIERDQRAGWCRR